MQCFHLISCFKAVSKCLTWLNPDYISIRGNKTKIEVQLKNNKHGRVKQQFTLNLTGCMPILFMLWRHLGILMECLPEENHIHKTSNLVHAKQQDGGALVNAGHRNTLGVIFFSFGKLT